MMYGHANCLYSRKDPRWQKANNTTSQETNVSYDFRNSRNNFLYLKIVNRS